MIDEAALLALALWLVLRTALRLEARWVTLLEILLAATLFVRGRACLRERTGLEATSTRSQGTTGLSALGLVRGLLGAVLALRVVQALWDATARDAAQAIAGILAVVAVPLLVGSMRRRVRTAPLVLLGGAIATGVLLHATLAHSAQATFGAWALATSLALALPAAPMPGAALARALGRAAAGGRREHAMGLLLLGATVTTLLLARGMTVLPLAALAAMAEGAEASRARHPSQDAAIARVGSDRERAVGVVLAAAVLVLLVGAVSSAHRTLHGPLPQARDAIAVLTR
jgi:hypothetical protein